MTLGRMPLFAWLNLVMAFLVVIALSTLTAALDGPARGRIGMFGLIAAESAIFAIFVVAYLFYLGKSLTGPIPKEVLDAPFFYTLCLLSSSITIRFI